VIQNPGFLPDHPKIESLVVFAIPDIPRKFSEKSVHNFLSYLADTQTNKQTNSGKNITSLAEVINPSLRNMYHQVPQQRKKHKHNIAEISFITCH